MQRIDRNERGATRNPLLGERREISEIADSPVTFRAQSVELDRGSPYASAVFQSARTIALRRSNDQKRFTQRLSAVRNDQPVISQRSLVRQQP